MAFIEFFGPKLIVFLGFKFASLISIDNLQVH
jgi:hypothetical protein